MNILKTRSTMLSTASMLLYSVWLMLPAVQVRLKAVTGMLSVFLFGISVLFDGKTLQNEWKLFWPRVICIAALPLLLFFFLDRGGDEILGFYAAQIMFWFPLFWCGQARNHLNRKQYKIVFIVMLAVSVITTLTTIGWLIEGMLREEGTVYAYARSLGDGSEGRQVYLNELMGRNIGGYGFIYASVFALPFVFYLAADARGWKRVGWTVMYILQVAVIGLSQYTYAMVFAAVITAVEIFGLILRSFIKKLSVSVSLLCAAPVIAAVLLLRIPLVTGLSSLASSLHFENVAISLNQLLAVLTDGTVAEGSRLEAYITSLQSFVSSPWVGGIFTGDSALGMHSEFLDALGGLGMIGTLVFGAGIWLIGRGMGKGITKTAAIPHLVLQWLAVGAFLMVGTVIYAREISLMLCLCAAFAIWTAENKSSIINHISTGDDMMLDGGKAGTP